VLLLRLLLITVTITIIQSSTHTERSCCGARRSDRGQMAHPCSLLDTRQQSAVLYIY
jgi:hypothetical protein